MQWHKMAKKMQKYFSVLLIITMLFSICPALAYAENVLPQNSAVQLENTVSYDNLELSSELEQSSEAEQSIVTEQITNPEQNANSVLESVYAPETVILEENTPEEKSGTIITEPSGNIAQEEETTPSTDLMLGASAVMQVGGSGSAGTVYVSVENTAYSKADGAAWEGKLLNRYEVPINTGDTMMNAVEKALTANNITTEGMSDNYISSINGLAAGSPDYLSGWMGMLNDWFVNEGLNNITLENGDEICLMFSRNGGEDIGGTWNNNDTSLKALEFSTGILSPEFSGATTEYTLTVPQGTISVAVTPTATNKNFQVRTYLGSMQYKRNMTVPVENGTVISVSCGDPNWPSMNTSEGATTYTINVQIEGQPVVSNHAPYAVKSTDTAEITLGESYSVDLSTIFIDSDGDELTYTASINDSDAETTVANYVYTPSEAGTYTIVFKASDGKSDLDTYTVTLTAKAPLTECNIKVFAFSSGGIKTVVFTDAEGNTIETEGGGRINKPYTMTVAPGTYYYKAYSSPTVNEENLTGSGYFNVTDNNQIIHLGVLYFSVYKAYSEDIGSDNYSILLYDEKGVAVQQGKTANTYVVVANQTFSYKITPENPRLQEVQGTCTLNSTSNMISISNAKRVEVPLSMKLIRTFRVSKGAGLRMFTKGNIHYVAFNEFTPDSIDTTSDENYDIYKFYLPSGKTCVYIAGENGTGYLKQAQTFEFRETDTINTYTVDLQKLDNSVREDNSYKAADIYMNVDDSKYIKLVLGETFDLETFRVWQTIDNACDNQFVEPDFHYEVIGDSISLTSGGMVGREYTTIKALKPGVSIVKITYDAMNTIANIREGATSFDSFYYNAIDPVNTGIVIVNVGADKGAVIQTNIGQREYDTIYYTETMVMPTGETKSVDTCAEYTFIPTADSNVSVRVHDPLHNTEWGNAWTDYSPNPDGSYSVKLRNGRNIIEISAGDSVEYYVVNAKALTVTIENKTNPGEVLKAGDEAAISFTGITPPIQKMAGIYNPGFPGTEWVQYETEDAKVIKSPGTQYNLAIINTITFSPEKAGTIKLANGQIHAGHLGSALDTHRVIPKTGLPPNLNASGGTNSPYFSTLPDIILYVQPKGSSIITFNVNPDDAIVFVKDSEGSRVLPKDGIYSLNNGST